MSPPPTGILALVLVQKRTTKSEGGSQSSFAEQLRAAVKLEIWSGIYDSKNEAGKPNRSCERSQDTHSTVLSQSNFHVF